MATINGTSANNSLVGTSSADTIQGYGGDDRIDGSDGDDIIYGGSGRDQLFGGTGNDGFLSGSDATPDWMTGGSGGDSFYFNVRGTTGLGTDTILDFRRSEQDKVKIEGDSFKATLSYFDKNGDGSAESTLIKIAATGTNQNLGTISVENARLDKSDLYLTGGTVTVASTASPAPTTPTAPTSPSTPTSPSPAPTPAPTPDTNTRHLYVSTSGSDSNAGTSSSPFKTIQKAASLATAGTTVHVASGVYTETVRTTKSGTESAPINYVSDVKGGAVIKPSGNSGVIWSDSGAYVTIRGFEIDGTNSPNSREGFMLTGAHSKVVNNHVHHILMAGSTDSNGGAGILLAGGYYNHWDQHAIGNTVHDVGNNSPRVHGIYHQGTGSIVNNIVYSTSQTGIVGWHDPHDILIANNTVFHNRNGIAFGAGDTYHSGSVANNMRVINNIVYDNTSSGIDESGVTGTNNVYLNNLVYKNGQNWSLQNGLQHQGTVTADPQFMNYLSGGGGNYHLKSGSPAVNSGTSSYSAPTTDISGYVRSNPDIGAYEWFAV